MPMRVIDAAAVAEKTGLKARTVKERRWRERNNFPSPVPITNHKSGFVEAEIDEWLESRVALRGENACKSPAASGRTRFWNEVRAGRRPHPRTVGKQRREAAEAQQRTALEMWRVSAANGRMNAYVPTVDDADRIAEEWCALGFDVTIERIAAR